MFCKLLLTFLHCRLCVHSDVCIQHLAWLIIHSKCVCMSHVTSYTHVLISIIQYCCVILIAHVGVSTSNDSNTAGMEAPDLEDRGNSPDAQGAPIATANNTAPDRGSGEDTRANGNANSDTTTTRGSLQRNPLSDRSNNQSHEPSCNRGGRGGDRERRFLRSKHME